MLIHILAGDSRYFNTYALIYPFIRYKKELDDTGIRVRVVNTKNMQLTDCDILILDSKVFRDKWMINRENTLNTIEELTDGGHKTLWFNTGDSTGLIQTQVIDLVDRYYKNQLLRDRQQYKSSHYGGRTFTHYYFTHQDVVDEEPNWGSPLNVNQINKLRLSWNLGMNPHMDYWANVRGRFLPNHPLGMGIDHKIPKASKLSNLKRDIAINARMSTNYSRATVAFQRQQLGKILGKFGVTTSKVSPRHYFSELARSNFSISPFGWGEVCIRDFEAILHGSVLVKPDMSDVETWPNIYIKNVTYLSFPWDPAQFNDWISENINKVNYQKNIALAALECYQKSIGSSGAVSFVEKIRSIISDLES